MVNLEPAGTTTKESRGRASVPETKLRHCAIFSKSCNVQENRLQLLKAKQGNKGFFRQVRFGPSIPWLFLLDAINIMSEYG